MSSRNGHFQKVICVLLSFVLGSTSVAAPVCSNIFSDSSPSLFQFFADRTLKRLDPNKEKSEPELTDILDRYYYYRNGDIAKIKDLKLSKEERRLLVFERLLERQILLNGIKPFFKEQWARNPAEGWRYYVMMWNKFKLSKWGRLLALPYSLPIIVGPEFKESMLIDLVLNGKKSVYAQEGEKIYSSTLKREYYKKISRLYTVAAYLFIIYYTQDQVSQILDEKRKEVSDQNKKQFMDALDQLEAETRSWEESGIDSSTHQVFKP